MIGPTSRTATISPDVNDPGFRNITFDQLVTAYTESIRGLVDGGSDILLVETIFDTLNAKAALFAIEQYFDDHRIELPVMISGTITDESGRTLTGQTAEAFLNSMRHAEPISIGFNCALGADKLRQYVEELASKADTYVSAHPNAGLPNPLSETGYDETPEQLAAEIRRWGEDGLLNIVGGCCGTSPAHIKAVAEAMEGLPPRRIPQVEKACRLSGLEPLNIGKDSLFVNVGDIVRALVANELIDDPNDFLATHLYGYVTHFSAQAEFYSALYLLSHGIIKVVLVVGLLRRYLPPAPGLAPCLLITRQK